MSSDEEFLLQLLRALADVKLEAIIVGTTAAALQAVPIMTQDVDLLVRDTDNNRKKLSRLGKLLGAAEVTPSPLSKTITLVGSAVPVDVLFDGLSGGLTFESLRSRALTVALGNQVATVAALEDIIRSKEASHRPKDQAQLSVLRAALSVKKALADKT